MVKLKLRIVFFALLACTYCKTSLASGKKELVLGIPSMSFEQLDALKSNLSAFTGITYKGYCAAERLVLIEFDSDVYEMKYVMEYIGQRLNLNAATSIFLKEGDFVMAEQLCAADKKMYMR